MPPQPDSASLSTPESKHCDIVSNRSSGSCTQCVHHSLRAAAAAEPPILQTRPLGHRFGNTLSILKTHKIHRGIKEGAKISNQLTYSEYYAA